MLGGDIFVLEFVRLFECLIKHVLQLVGEMRLVRAAARDFWQSFHALHGPRLNYRRVSAQFLQHRHDNTFAVLRQRY